MRDIQQQPRVCSARVDDGRRRWKKKMAGEIWRGWNSRR
jgi:hypothetical protein